MKQNHQNIKVQKINVSELKNMCQLNKIGGNCYDDEVQVLDFFDNEFQPETIYVAKIDDNYVGHIELFEGYKSSIGKFLLIRRLIVHPEWRKKGIGKTFLNFAVAECKRRKIKNLDLLAEDDNKIAYSIYKKMDFQEIGREIHMRKKV